MPSLRVGENQAHALAVPLLPGTVKSKPQAVSKTTGCNHGAFATLSLNDLGPLPSFCTCMQIV